MGKIKTTEGEVSAVFNEEPVYNSDAVVECVIGGGPVPFCTSVPNFVKIGQTVAVISRFL